MFSWRPTCPSANFACWPTSARTHACWPHTAMEISISISRLPLLRLASPQTQVTEQQRGIGKQVNFAIIYGMTADGLAQKLEIAPFEAQALLDGYFAAYPGVRAWIAQVHAAAYEDRQVRTLSGRRRRLPDIRSRDPAAVAAARRQAVNSIVQGTAADLLKMALIRLHDALPDDVTMLLSVHDSVLLEVPTELVEETSPIIVAAMERVPAGFNVPLKAEAKAGRLWAACK